MISLSSQKSNAAVTPPITFGNWFWPSSLRHDLDGLVAEGTFAAQGCVADLGKPAFDRPPASGR